MEQSQLNKLHEDANWGKLAQHAFDSYLKHVFDKIDKDIFNTFITTPFDEDEILELKRFSMVLAALKDRVQVDIDNGLLAQKQLTEETKH